MGYEVKEHRMKPIKIVQRRTKKEDKLLIFPSRSRDGVEVFTIKGGVQTRILYTKPTARRLAAALLKIAGEK